MATRLRSNANLVLQDDKGRTTFILQAFPEGHMEISATFSNRIQCKGKRQTKKTINGKYSLHYPVRMVT